MILVLGIDPGFSSLGYALVDLSAEPELPLMLGVIRTEKSDAKRAVRATDDNLRRIRELTATLHPLFDGVVAVCSESQSWPRNASVAAKLGMSWGVLGALSELKDLPFLQMSPQELKKAVCGNKSAGKEEVKAALDARYGRDFAAELVKKGVPAGQHEHAYDALGAVVASLDSEMLRLARKMA